MDLLLFAHDEGNTGVPAVGEIKVGRDETPFFALIQCLTYAAELCTPNQLARLQQYYPAFRERIDGRLVDICLVFSQLDAEHGRILATTKELVCKMYRNQPQFGELIRHVVFLEAVLREGRLCLACLARYPN